MRIRGTDKIRYQEPRESILARKPFVEKHYPDDWVSDFDRPARESMAPMSGLPIILGAMIWEVLRIWPISIPLLSFGGFLIWLVYIGLTH
jgi:hypothetical protein